MDFPNWVQALPFILLNLVNRYFQFLIQAWPFFLFLLLDGLFYHFFKTELGEFYPFRPKTANLLFLGRNEFCKRSAISDLSDERILEIQRPPYSRLSIIGRIKYNLYDFGELRTACRVWKGYCVKRDAVVYVVDARMEQFSEARGELNDLLSDEDFANLPFLIFCETPEPSHASEKELCFLLGLTDKTTGKGRVKLSGNARPLEVFKVEPHNINQYLNAIEWLSQYVKK